MIAWEDNLRFQVTLSRERERTLRTYTTDLYCSVIAGEEK